MTVNPPPPSELQALARLSAQLGADSRLIQAAGGNTSVKIGATLWVKASGLWLRDALTRPTFVPVVLDRVRQNVAAQLPDPVAGSVDAAQAQAAGAAALRPSIETTLHALMPHPVVLHVHAVDAIAWAVLPGAPSLLRAALAAHRWAWVPYARPGVNLTRAVAALLNDSGSPPARGASAAGLGGSGDARAGAPQDAGGECAGGDAGRTGPADVLVLANHGLVVGGSSVADAADRLQRVCAALRRAPRPAPLADLAALQALAQASGWALPRAARVHTIALDPLNLARAQRGVLYPDHVVFLGRQLRSAPAGLQGHALQVWLRQVWAPSASPTTGTAAAPPCVAVPGLGLLVHPQLDEAAQEMLACWADVLQALPERCAALGASAAEAEADAGPQYLSDAEAQGLADWEAEKFRRQQQR